MAYTDDIVIIGRTKLPATFSTIERESTNMGLAVNEGKTMLQLRSKNNRFFFKFRE